MVVCPSSVKNQWEREIDKWSPDVKLCQVIRKGTDKIQNVHVYIVSYGLANKLANQLDEIGVLLVDEIHYCKSLFANRTMHVLGDEYLGGKAKVIWGMTGTPIYNRPIDLYTLLLCLYPQALVKAPTYIEFAKRYNSGY